MTLRLKRQAGDKEKAGAPAAERRAAGAGRGGPGLLKVLEGEMARGGTATDGDPQPSSTSENNGRCVAMQRREMDKKIQKSSRQRFRYMVAGRPPPLQLSAPSLSP